MVSDRAMRKGSVLSTIVQKMRLNTTNITYWVARGLIKGLKSAADKTTAMIIMYGANSVDLSRVLHSVTNIII